MEVDCSLSSYIICFLQVKRQDERMLVTAVDELAYGKLSQETVSFLQSLDRPLKVSPSTKKVLFNKNTDVDTYNKQQLALLDSPSKTYLAVDYGDSAKVAKTGVVGVGTWGWNKLTSVMFMELFIIEDQFGYYCISNAVTTISSVSPGKPFSSVIKNFLQNLLRVATLLLCRP